MNGQPQGFADKVGFNWSVADLLSGVFRPHEYGQVILPFVGAAALGMFARSDQTSRHR